MSVNANVSVSERVNECECVRAPQDPFGLFGEQGTQEAHAAVPNEARLSMVTSGYLCSLVSCTYLLERLQPKRCRSSTLGQA